MADQKKSKQESKPEETADPKGQKSKEKAWPLPPVQLAAIILLLIIVIAGVAWWGLLAPKQAVTNVTVGTPTPIATLGPSTPNVTIKVFYSSNYTFLPNVTRTVALANTQLKGLNITFEAVDITDPKLMAAFRAIGLSTVPVVVVPPDALRNDVVKKLIDDLKNASQTQILAEGKGGYAISYFYMFFNVRKPEQSLDPYAADHLVFGRQCLNNTPTLYEFFDYDSPNSRETYTEVQRALRVFNNSVNFRLWWTPVRPAGRIAAKAAYCVQAQQPEFSFSLFHERMIADANYSESEVRSKAYAVGVNQTVFDECFKSNTTDATITGLFDSAVNDYGVVRLPMFAVDCQFVFAPIAANFSGELVNKTCAFRPEACGKNTS